MSFYTDLAQHYHHIFPVSTAQIQFLEQHITGNKILEMGTALGDCISQLKKPGRSLYGIDLDEGMINLAKLKHDLVNFKTLNILDIENSFPKEKFNFIFSFGNTISHITNEEKLKLFKRVKKLCPKGKFAFQIINYDRILDQNIRELPDIDNEFLNFKRKYKTDGSKFVFKTSLEIKNNGNLYKNEIELFPQRSEDIRQSLLKSGYQNLKFYGDFKQSSFCSKNSYHLVVVAEV